MEIAQLVLEYLKVILSAPVMGGAVAITFLCLFRGEINALIGRIARIRFPGGELFASQQERTQAEIAPREQPPAPPQGQQVQLPPSVTLTPEQAQQVVGLIQSERAHAALWEYRYLNFFLARSTQLVLDWLGTLQQPISVNLLDSYLQAFIVDAQERLAILTALQNPHLIMIANNLVQITPKGREYLQWRGPLPATQLPNPGFQPPSKESRRG